jgi:hypothetical protein
LHLRFVILTLSLPKGKNPRIGSCCRPFLLVILAQPESPSLSVGCPILTAVLSRLGWGSCRPEGAGAFRPLKPSPHRIGLQPWIGCPIHRPFSSRHGLRTISGSAGNGGSEGVGCNLVHNHAGGLRKWNRRPAESWLYSKNEALPRRAGRAPD